MNNLSEPKIELRNLNLALIKELGLPVTNLLPLDPKDLGDHSEVFVGELNGEKVYIKIQTEPKAFIAEKAALEFLSEKEIPVPRVLGFTEQSTILGRSIIVQTKAIGTCLNKLSSSELNDGLCEEVGKMLKIINSIKVDGFGEFKLGDGTLVGKDKTWRDNMIAYQPDFQFLKDNSELTPEELKAVQEVQAEMENIELHQAFFLHSDYQRPHLFTDGKAVTGVIDLGGAHAGDPRRDIATAHFHLDDKQITAFNRGYGVNPADEQIIEKYKLLLSAYKLGYRMKNNFTERIPEALQKVREGLGKIKSDS